MVAAGRGCPPTRSKGHISPATRIKRPHPRRGAEDGARYSLFLLTLCDAQNAPPREPIHIGYDGKANLLNLRGAAAEASYEANSVKGVFKCVLIGTLIIFVITTILSSTGLATSLGEDEEVLHFIRITSLFAAIVSTMGLIVVREQ